MSSRVTLVASGGRRVIEEPAALVFERFFEDQAPTLYRRMCLVTGDRGEAEEVVQEAFLALLERWDRVAAMDDPVGYLYRAAFNRWRKRTRRLGRHVRAMAGLASTSDEFGRDAFDVVDDRESIDRALAELTPRQRAALVLVDVLGCTSREAAEMMGIRDVTVRVLASQARSTMRDVIGGADA
jgi:RNA polymerase sigma-70 factor (ECF subfamily)